MMKSINIQFYNATVTITYDTTTTTSYWQSANGYFSPSAHFDGFNIEQNVINYGYFITLVDNNGDTYDSYCSESIILPVTCDVLIGHSFLFEESVG